MGKFARVIRTCIWSVDGLCECYNWKSGNRLRCDGRHVTCIGKYEELSERYPDVDDWAKKRRELERRV